MTDITTMKEIKLHDLKEKSPGELLILAETLEVENASALRKQELMFAILKSLASREVDIIGEGVVEDGLVDVPQLSGGARRHAREPRDGRPAAGNSADVPE